MNKAPKHAPRAKRAPHHKAANKRHMSTQKKKNAITLILGAPAGGKGTISKKLKKDFGVHHISTGDLLRKEMSNQTELGNKAKDFINAGELVPDDVVIGMVESEIAQVQDKPILLDGFPRTLQQALALKRVVAVDKVINLRVPDQEIVERVSGRWTHLPSGRVYSLDFNPPKNPGVDDETGEALVQRSDDTVEAVTQRLKTYHEKTSPLVAFYEESNILTHYDGSNEPELVAKGKRSDAIYAAVRPDMLSIMDPVNQV